MGDAMRLSGSGLATPAPQSDAGSQIYVRQGEFAVSSDPMVYLSAILGSCVSTCLYDEAAGVGGMNHILLPHDDRHAGDELETLNLMELLINELMKRGADRSSLKGKLFGGARMMQTSAQIGLMNAEFARRFLEDEGIPCVAESLGGDVGRKIRFWPVGGRASQFMLDRLETEIATATPKLPPAPDAGSIELF